MSKILFWSPLHGQGQTSNLHVTAFIMGLLYKKRVLMMQTHFVGNNLESPLVGQNVDNSKRPDNDLFRDVGLDVAVTYSSMNKLSSEILENCCLTFPETPLLLLPGTETKNRETFERDIGRTVSNMIKDADEFVDMILIDTNSGEDKLSLALMKTADLIVVNMTQHRYVLDKFFLDYIDRFPDKKKVFYLFGDYDDKSSYNLSNFRRKYHKYINRKNSGVIPYSTKFLDAQNENDVAQFMQEGLRIHRQKDSNNALHTVKKSLYYNQYSSEETRYLFHRSCLAVEKMMDMLQISDKTGDREVVAK